MRIAPKIAAEHPQVPELIVPYLHDAVEFHLRSFTEEDTNWKVIAAQYGLKHITLHAPFGVHNIEEVVLSPDLRESTTLYLSGLKQYAEEQDIEVSVLFHVSYTMESVITLQIARHLNEVLERVGKSEHLNILLENTVANLDMCPVKGYKDALSYLLSETSPEQVMMCFDLCHYKASKNVLLEEYSLPDEWLPRIQQIHFSCTKNNEGYRHLSTTHGKVHTNLWCVACDLCYMKSLGIDLSNSLLVTELGEENYSTRSLEAKELEWLYRINETGLTV